MCYLCDLCANLYRRLEYANYPMHFWCGETDRLVMNSKRVIDYGKDDPKEICKHFEPKEERDD